MAKTEIIQKPKNNTFIGVMLVLIFIVLSLIAYSFSNTNQTLVDMNNKLTEIEDITRSTGRQVSLINDFTGQQALSNPRKDSLDKCIRATNSYSGSSQDHTALLILCIGNYLAN